MSSSSGGGITKDNPSNCAAIKSRVPEQSSQARNSFRFVFNSAANRIPPVIVKIGNLPTKSFLVYADRKRAASYFTYFLTQECVLTHARSRLFQGGMRA